MHSGGSAPVRRPRMAAGAVHGKQGADVGRHAPRDARYGLLGGLARCGAAPHGLNNLQGRGNWHLCDMAPCMRSLAADRPATA